jgi:hypothetical protein
MELILLRGNNKAGKYAHENLVPGVQIVFIFMNDIGTTFSHIASMIRTPCLHRNECSLMQHRNRLQA